jgi:hypothetical protein
MYYETIRVPIRIYLFVHIATKRKIFSENFAVVEFFFILAPVLKLLDLDPHSKPDNGSRGAN